MIKTILVPMGTSESSRSALKTAVNIANLFKASLKLFYVEDISKIKEVIIAFGGSGGSPYVPGREEEALKKIELELEKEKKEVQKIYDETKSKIEVEHSLEIRPGIVADEILKESEKADLIIMGEALKEDKKGEIQKSIFRVIQKSKTPMITINKGDSLGKNILIAYDGSASANNALKMVENFITPLSPKIFILTVTKNEDEGKPLLDKGAEHFSSHKVEVEKIWKKGKAAKAILDTIKEKEISFVVMGGYGDNKLKEFFLGSTTAVIIKKIAGPVMVCNA